MVQKYYGKEFKRNIVRRHIEEGKTIKSLAEEYGVSKTSIKIWCKEFSEECQNKAKKDSTAKNELELMKENRQLREKVSEYEKEVQFLKKAAAFFAREIID